MADNRETMLTRINTYVQGLSDERLAEMWARIGKSTGHRAILLAYIMEHHFDENVPTDEHPRGAALNDLPDAKLAEIAGKIAKTVQALEPH